MIASPLTYAQATATAPAADAGRGDRGHHGHDRHHCDARHADPDCHAYVDADRDPDADRAQSRLILGNTYLQGRDYERAAQLFREVAEEDRGSAEALAGLAAGAGGQCSRDGDTDGAPAGADARACTARRRADAGRHRCDEVRDARALRPALLPILALYFAAHLLRWVLYWLRELWYRRILPLLGRPAVEPGYLIGHFTNTLGGAGENAAALVPFALADKLLAWNQLVQAKEVPVEPEPALDLGGMSWLKVFWRWILPAPRGYRVTGALLPGARGAYRLAVQRIDLARNSVERSATFELTGTSPDIAYRDLAGEAAKWLVKPVDMEAAAASMRGLRSARSQGQPEVLSPSEIFDQALALLLPVRQQVSQGAVDFGDARERLRQAVELLADLPPESSLRKDLETVIADLRRQIPGS